MLTVMDRACDVCRLVDGDETPKPSTFCHLCNAWICKACESDVMRRAQAWRTRSSAELKAWQQQKLEERMSYAPHS